MKVAIIGKGNTGQAVIELLKKDNIHAIFDSSNIVTAEKLKGADVIIVFVSAEVLDQILEILLVVNIPVICGTTGFVYTQQIIKTIDARQKTWIVANNFSLSMVFIKEAIFNLGKLKVLIPQARYSIEETHHTKKLDAPSGTALAWQQWHGIKDCQISSERLGDVKGIHSLHIDYDYESIELKHIAHDRKLFAEGAIWAAKYVMDNYSRGFCQFETLVKEQIDGVK